MEENWNIWYENLKYKKTKQNKNISPTIQLLLDSNFFFAAIYDLQKDLINKISPFLFPYKDLSNDSTHKRLILSWYGSLDKEIKSYSLKKFQKITYSFLKIAKATIKPRLL